MEDNQDSDNQESRFKRIKRHIKENKTTYLVGGVCLGAGYFLRKPQVVGPVFNNHNIGNVVNTTVNNGGHMRKIVRCLETDEMWPSVSKAAEAADMPIQIMSKHINGHKDHIDGLHYVIEGLATG